ncbi:Cytochrome c553 [Edwardsiella anguillarum]|uniref:c-type cytochrome n=1 Tax=Edwardsiella TaxID=635 RepID=UPI00045D17BD|nr:c-type cytochrome [Edwardsiella anguillarum]AKM48689.1 cytochrome C554 [Edwardsiella sp. EA181011]GAJ66749.1 cytochrome c-552 [Edwardsiella piscicida]RFS99837.1 cytochrome C554 [Edwardsiella anguillarum]BET79959.1 Cytochrome c553 [Edwardsiella anguillarum]BET83247.1 Cytochrome c553 [Edwardsiella anguillarum]
MKRGVMGILALALALPLAAQAGGDAAAGRQKSASCASCHGVQGQGLTPIYPPLAGLSAQRLVEAMQEYKAGTRHGGQAGIMSAYVARLSGQDMADLAAYYASLTPPAAP